MALNLFLGKSQEWLEAQLALAQEDFAAGSAMTKAEAGDARTETETNVSSVERIKQLLKALHAIDPDTYPLDQITAIDRTRISLWRNDNWGTLP